MTEAIKSAETIKPEADEIKAPAKPAAAEPKAPAKEKAPKKYKVTVHTSESEKGDVVIGHNFRLITIKRDVEVEIDECYVNALKGSVIETFIEDENGKRRAVTIPRYAFSATPV